MSAEQVDIESSIVTMGSARHTTLPPSTNVGLSGHIDGHTKHRLTSEHVDNVHRLESRKFNAFGFCRDGIRYVKFYSSAAHLSSIYPAIQIFAVELIKSLLEPFW